jgi:hypothetical protein
MSVDSKIHNARAALLTLADLAYYMDETNSPADEFGYGLSVLLEYVANDLDEAQKEFFQYTKKVQNKKNHDPEKEAPERPGAAGEDMDALLKQAVGLVPVKQGGDFTPLYIPRRYV